MEIERIDHIQMKSPDYENSAKALREIIGRDMYVQMEFTEDEGAEVAYEPFPIGIELFRVTDPTKTTGSVADSSPVGPFAISYKVTDIQKGIHDLETLGYRQIKYFDFGPIQEVLFDTKDRLGFYLELIEYKGNNIVEAFAGGA